MALTDTPFSPPVEQLSTVPTEIRPAVAPSRHRVATRAAAARVALAAAFCAGCTDPLSIGPRPDYLGVLVIEESIVDSVSSRQLPADSCPAVTVATGASRRRPAPQMKGSIALPEATVELPNAFGRIPGIVYQVPTTGIIAITFDNLIASFLTSPIFEPRTSNRFASNPFVSWCPATIGAAAAKIYVEPYVVLRGTTQSVYFARGMAITTVSPNGRRVNIRISADPDSGLGEQEPQKVRQLLNVVGTIQWDR